MKKYNCQIGCEWNRLRRSLPLVEKDPLNLHTKTERRINEGLSIEILKFKREERRNNCSQYMVDSKISFSCAPNFILNSGTRRSELGMFSFVVQVRCCGLNVCYFYTLNHQNPQRLDN